MQVPVSKSERVNKMAEISVVAWAVQISDGCLSFEPFGDKLARFRFEAKNLIEVEKAIEAQLETNPTTRLHLAQHAARKYPENGFVDFSIIVVGGRKFANFDKLKTTLERKLRLNASEYIAAHEALKAELVAEAVREELAR